MWQEKRHHAEPNVASGNLLFSVIVHFFIVCDFIWGEKKETKWKKQQCPHTISSLLKIVLLFKGIELMLHDNANGAVKVGNNVFVLIEKSHLFFCRADFDFIWGLVALLLPSAHTCIYDAKGGLCSTTTAPTKRYVKLSPVVIVVTLQCAKVYVCIWMYVLDEFFGKPFCFLLFFCFFFLIIYSLGATGVQCELYYSEGLDIPSSFIDFRYAKLTRASASKLVTFGAGAKIATRLKSM